jgi:hypothetical protein
MTEIKPNERQLTMMNNALGREKRYRNHYSVNRGSEEHTLWLQLVASGLAVFGRESPKEPIATFHVSDDGIAYLDQIKEESCRTTTPFASSAPQSSPKTKSSSAKTAEESSARSTPESSTTSAQAPVPSLHEQQDPPAGYSIDSGVDAWGKKDQFCAKGPEHFQELRDTREEAVQACWADRNMLLARLNVPLTADLEREVEALEGIAEERRHRAKTAELKNEQLEHETRKLRAQNEALHSQLPEGMKHCSILFRECEHGHGRLTAANWIDHGCSTCGIEALIEALRGALEQARACLVSDYAKGNAQHTDTLSRINAALACSDPTIQHWTPAPPVSKPPACDHQRIRNFVVGAEIRSECLDCGSKTPYGDAVPTEASLDGSTSRFEQQLAHLRAQFDKAIAFIAENPNAPVTEMRALFGLQPDAPRATRHLTTKEQDVLHSSLHKSVEKISGASMQRPDDKCTRCGCVPYDSERWAPCSVGCPHVDPAIVEARIRADERERIASGEYAKWRVEGQYILQPHRTYPACTLESDGRIHINRYPCVSPPIPAEIMRELLDGAAPPKRDPRAGMSPMAIESRTCVPHAEFDCLRCTSALQSEETAEAFVVRLKAWIDSGGMEREYQAYRAKKSSEPLVAGERPYLVQFEWLSKRLGQSIP